MKRILLFTVLLACSVNAFSQDIKYGVRGGLNLSKLAFDDDSPVVEHEQRNSIFIGFLAHIGLSKTVALMPELQFSAEGAKAEPLHLDYVQLPVLLKFRLSEKFHIGLGPQAGVKIPKKDDGMKTMAFSGVGGVEFKISHTIFADFRYTQGFSNVFDDDLGMTAKNGNFQLGVGYKF